MRSWTSLSCSWLLNNVHLFDQSSTKCIFSFFFFYIQQRVSMVMISIEFYAWLVIRCVSRNTTMTSSSCEISTSTTTVKEEEKRSQCVVVFVHDRTRLTQTMNKQTKTTLSSARMIFFMFIVDIERDEIVEFVVDRIRISYDVGYEHSMNRRMRKLTCSQCLSFRRQDKQQTNYGRNVHVIWMNTSIILFTVRSR
jgi:hypothetical protein